MSRDRETNLNQALAVTRLQGLRSQIRSPLYVCLSRKALDKLCSHQDLATMVCLMDTLVWPMNSPSEDRGFLLLNHIWNVLSALRVSCLISRWRHSRVGPRGLWFFMTRWETSVFCMPLCILSGSFSIFGGLLIDPSQLCFVNHLVWRVWHNKMRVRMRKRI